MERGYGRTRSFRLFFLSGYLESGFDISGLGLHGQFADLQALFITSNLTSEPLNYTQRVDYTVYFLLCGAVYTHSSIVLINDRDFSYNFRYLIPKLTTPVR